MAHVKAVMTSRVRDHLATPEKRREFLEAYLGISKHSNLRFEHVGAKIARRRSDKGSVQTRSRKK